MKQELCTEKYMTEARKEAFWILFQPKQTKTVVECSEHALQAQTRVDAN
jgi:hypothetical protein